MLFWRANWIPFTISGISGTMARTVTPMKYCRRREKRWYDQRKTTRSKLTACAQKHVLTWETLGWFSMGWMCSVARSAQADVSTVAMMRMTRDLHRDQWTTAPWGPFSAQTSKEIILALDHLSLSSSGIIQGTAMCLRGCFEVGLYSRLSVRTPPHLEKQTWVPA